MRLQLSQHGGDVDGGRRQVAVGVGVLQGVHALPVGQPHLGEGLEQVGKGLTFSHLEQLGVLQKLVLIRSLKNTKYHVIVITYLRNHESGF